MNRDLRRRARRQGMPLIKYLENSPWYHQYGPYALADQRTHIVCRRAGLRRACFALGWRPIGGVTSGLTLGSLVYVWDSMRWRWNVLVPFGFWCVFEFRCGSWVGGSNSCRRSSCSSRDPAGVMAMPAPAAGGAVEHGPHQAEAAGLAGQPADDLHPPAGLAEGAFDEVGVPDPLMVLDGQTQIAGQLLSVREQALDRRREVETGRSRRRRRCDSAQRQPGPALGRCQRPTVLQCQRSPRTRA